MKQPGNNRKFIFDARYLDIAYGDLLVVETRRGTSLGIAISSIITADSEDIKRLTSATFPLMTVMERVSQTAYELIKGKILADDEDERYRRAGELPFD